MNQQEYRERSKAETKGCIEVLIPFFLVSAIAAIIAFVSMLSSGADFGKTIFVTLAVWIGGALLIAFIWFFIVKGIDPD